MVRPPPSIWNAPWKSRPPIPARLTLPWAVTWIRNGLGTNVNVNEPSISTRLAIVTLPWRMRWRPGAIETDPVLIDPSVFVCRLPSEFVRNVIVCCAVPGDVRSLRNRFTSSMKWPESVTPGIALELRASVTRPTMPGLITGPVPSGFDV